MRLGGGNLLTVGLLVLIMAVAIFFRFFGLDYAPPGLYPDEAMNGVNALEALESNDYKVFYPDNNGREGLYINIQAFALKLFGKHIWVLRAVSGVFGLIMVLGIFFLAGLIFGRRVAFLASYLASISFWAVNFSRIGFRAIMLPAVLVWSFYFFWRGIEKKSTWQVSLAGLIFGLGMHTYISFRIAPLVLIFMFVVFFFQNKIPRPTLFKWGFVFLVCSILVASPLLLYYAKNPADFFGRAGQVSIFASASPVVSMGSAIVKTLGMFNFVGDFNWRHNLSGRPLLFWPIGIAFLFGLLIMFSRLRKPTGTKSAFILAWFFFLLLPNFLAPEGAPHALRALGAMPAVFIMAAIGFNWVYEKLEGYLEKISYRPENVEFKGQIFRIKKEIAALGILVLMLFGALETKAYFIKWAFNSHTREAFTQRLVDIGDFLKISKREHKYVIVNEAGVLVNGIHMPAKTVEFVAWEEKNEINFINGEDISSLPRDLSDAIIIPVIADQETLNKLSQIYPEGKFVKTQTFTRVRVP